MTLPHNQSQGGPAPGPESDEYRVAALVFYGCIFVIGLLVNATALWVFSCSTKKRTTVTVYMMNVALLDLVFVGSLPFRMAAHAQGRWPFGRPLCHVLGTLTALYPSIALWLLALISADRYMAIVQPRHAKELRNTGKAALACAGVWAMTLAVTVPLQLLDGEPGGEGGAATCWQLFEAVHSRAGHALTLTRLLLFFLTPLGIMLGCYLVIVHSLLRGRTSRLKPKVKEKSIRIIATLVAQVLLCFTPFHVCVALQMRAGEEEEGGGGPGPWGAFTAFLMNLSTCLDVILYYIVSKQFQARVISVMLYRNYLRSVRRKSVRSGSLRSLSHVHSEML
ncbi:N-arachidonyl glycine receptor [Sorex araneus]|uniref:N-arachidonyl glycine receptor n=1 Tax=Sorex araneus TaxID=42254 RepID=UPI002433D66D|nr:N-arachidonyl glycine receptor [Sorex araneus]